MDAIVNIHRTLMNKFSKYNEAFHVDVGTDIVKV